MTDLCGFILYSQLKAVTLQQTQQIIEVWQISKIAEFLKAYDYVKEFGEGVDRMCRELSAIGTKEPHYHLVAFIMKASVWANVLKEGQKRARKYS